MKQLLPGTKVIITFPPDVVFDNGYINHKSRYILYQPDYHHYRTRIGIITGHVDRASCSLYRIDKGPENYVYYADWVTPLLAPISRRK